jgi:hypothetical protein
MTKFTKLGFTGSREEPSDYQKEKIRQILTTFKSKAENQKVEFHHGDCVGSDAYAATTAKELGYWVVSHPPTDTKLQAYAPSDEIRTAKPYLDRNRDIVNETQAMLATPSKPETNYGGTWYTIRYARTNSKPIVVFER